jgi:hypothetical protein
VYTCTRVKAEYYDNFSVASASEEYASSSWLILQI